MTKREELLSLIDSIPTCADSPECGDCDFRHWVHIGGKNMPLCTVLGAIETSLKYFEREEG